MPCQASNEEDVTTIPMAVKFSNRSRAVVKFPVGENPLNRSAKYPDKDNEIV